MKRFMPAAIIAGFLLAITWLPLSVRGDNPDIQGKITKIHKATAESGQGIIGSIMVEAEQKPGKVDKANLIITEETRILKEQDEERVQATFEDLQVQQTVDARFAKGPTIMIYPLQVKASEIVILKSE